MTQRRMDLRESLRDWEFPGQRPCAAERGIPGSPVGADTYVRYDLLVAGGEVDKVKWREIMNELLDDVPHRNQSLVARNLGISRKTLDRWLDPDWQGAVSEGSVRQVAERTGRNLAELLVRVGYLAKTELPYPPEDEWIIEVIRASRLPRAAQDLMIAVQLEQAERERAEHRRRIEDQITLMDRVDISVTPAKKPAPKDPDHTI